MNDQTDKSKGFLKDKLDEYQINPPEKVWDSISDQLGGGRSRRSMLILALAAAASLALAVTLGIHYFDPDLPQEFGLAEETAQGEITPADNSEEAMSPLEERVIETMETAATERSDNPGKTEEVQLSLAMQNQPMAEENEAMIPDEDASQEQIRDQEQISDPVQVSIYEAVSEPEAPVDSVEVAALTLEGNDPLPNEPVPDFMEDKKRDVRWMVGAVVSPLYSFRDAEANVMAGAGVHESGLLSYSSGIHVNYRRHSRLAFETGIFFNKTGLAIDASGIQSFNQQSDYLLFGAGSEQADIKAVTNSVGNIISNSGEIYVNGYKLNAENTPEATMDNVLTNSDSPTSGIQQHLDYLELPFNLRYTVIDRTIELQLVWGVSTNFLVNNYVTMETSSGQEEIGYLSNIRSVNYSGNAGLGMIYHVGKKLSLMLEPRFRYFLNSINDSSLPSTRPYSVGLYTGLNYTF
ncbi:MAG: hypothetical protein KAR16_07505 [Bacteroidales bacterium]|nr:hypothetical protein [Bacteroidales bacterium]